MNQDLSSLGPENVEHSMLLQRPAPVKCQDINHVLTSALRDILGKDKLCMTTVENLITSKGSNDPYHEKYVDLLNQVCKERESRMSQISMLERHLMQVQARVISADERMLNTFKSFGGYETLDIPKGFSCYQSYVNSSLLKENGLIVPDDYIRDEMAEITKRLLIKSDPSYLQTTVSWLNHNYEKSRLYSDALAEKLFTPTLDTKMNLSTPELSMPILAKNLQLSLEQLKTPSRKQSVNVTKSLLSKKSFTGLVLPQVSFLQNPRYTRLTTENKPKLLTEVDEDRTCQELPKSVEVQSKEPPLFLPTPQEILFTNYRCGEIYEAKLELKNISAVLRPCRVIPPASKYFIVGLGQFPTNQGLVAPGMSCIYTIRFAPDTLGSFKDELQVMTQSSTNIKVPLIAKRPHPVLTLPSELDIGFCLIDCKLITHVVVQNVGGSGCFCMMPADLWNTTAFKTYAHEEYIAIPPFSIGPATFGMKKNLVGVLEVRFEPHIVGKYSCKLAIVCDNCEVKYFTIIGHCEKAKVMLMEHENVCSKPLPNESYDGLAHHLIRFKNINSFSFQEKMIKIKNCTSIDFPFFWFPVKPDFQRSNKSKPNRVAEKNSAFRVFPNYGRLRANAEKQFQIIFAPEKVGSYDCVWHMILEELPSHSDIFNSSFNVTDRRFSIQFLKSIEKELQKRMSSALLGDSSDLMLAMKGRCVPFAVLIQPYALFIHEPILIGSTERRQVQVNNNSINEINFHWQCEDFDLFTIQMVPSEGTLEPGKTKDCELCLSAIKPGDIKISLKCYIEYQEEPIHYHLQASIKGPEVIIENSSIDFGLVCLGECVMKELILHNKSPVPAEFYITQIPESEIDPIDLNITITDGILEPYQSLSINMSFAPDSVYSLKTNLLLDVVDGCTSIVAVRGEVDVPLVVLESCQLDMGAISCGIVNKFKVCLVNNSYVEAQYEWLTSVGSQAHLCNIEIIPSQGIINPTKKEHFSLTFFSKEKMVFNDVFMRCQVMEMPDLLCLAITADVKGLIIQYQVSQDRNFIEESNYGNEEPVVLNFDKEVMVGTKPCLYLRIKNVTEIESTYSVSAEKFPVDNSVFQPSKKGVRINSKLLKPFTSPSTKNTDNVSSRAEASPTQINGAGLLIEPLCGMLPAFSYVIVKITLISSMWGNYTDNLICKTGDLDAMRIPVVFNIVGSPLQFLIVGPASNEEPKIRFGFFITGMNPVQRNVRIYNNSVFDIRIDWRVFNVYEDDQQIVDLNIYYGTPFPLLGDNSKTNDSAQEDLHNCPANTEGKREKIISINCTPHIGINSNDQFQVIPEQMIIKGNSDECLMVMYTPPINETSTRPCSYLSYACGFFSLDHEQQERDSQKGIIRPEGWNKIPLKIHMTADVLVAKLTVELSTDEKFMDATLGEIFSFDKKPKVNHKVFSLKLLNEMEAPMSFKLRVTAPFCFLDPAIYETLDEDTQMLSKLFTLMPRGALFVKVGFLMSEKLIYYWKRVECDSVSQECDCELQECKIDSKEMHMFITTVAGQKWLYFQHSLQIEFGSSTVQKVLLNARIALPEVVVSTNYIDFQACCIGQQKTREFLITNVSHSKSYIIISSEINCVCCDSDVFLVQPTKIKLNGYTVNAEKHKTTVTVTFNPQKIGFHNCVLTLHGIMDEKPKTIQLKGKGSHDEKHLIINENR